MGKTSGFIVKFYRYYDHSTKSVDFEGIKEDLIVSLGNIL